METRVQGNPGKGRQRHKSSPATPNAKVRRRAGRRARAGMGKGRWQNGTGRGMQKSICLFCPGKVVVGEAGNEKDGVCSTVPHCPTCLGNPQPPTQRNSWVGGVGVSGGVQWWYGGGVGWQETCSMGRVEGHACT